jgi:uncharacterized protein (DUF58 family)
VEFAGHREYVPGDDPKHVDWRVYFTCDKLFVKQYELETNFVCHLVLDVSASMRYGEGREQKLLYAGQMAVMLGYSVVRQSDKAALATFDDRVRGFVAPSNSMDQIVRMTHHLDEIEPVEKTNMAECLNEIAGRLGRREIVFVFSDFFTDLDALEPVFGLKNAQFSSALIAQNSESGVVYYTVTGSVDVTYDGLAMRFVPTDDQTAETEED